MGFLFGKSSSVKRADFWRVFGVLCQGDLSLAEIWNIADSWADKKLRNKSKEICDDLERNCYLRDVVLKYPKIFCLLEMQMIKSGEILNNLDEQLKELSETLYKVGLPLKTGYKDVYEKESESVKSENLLQSDSIVESESYRSDVKPVMKLFFYILQRAVFEHIEEIRIIPEVDFMKVSYKTVKNIYIPKHFANLPKKIYEIMVVEVKKMISITEINEVLEDDERYLHFNFGSQEHSSIISFLPSQNGEMIIIKMEEVKNEDGHEEVS